MRIPAINNNTNNNQNFTGVFKDGKEIRSFIKGARQENRLRFKNILERMKKVKDDYVYYLEKKEYKNIVHSDSLFEEPIEEISTGFELARYKGGDKTKRQWLAGFEDDGYMSEKLSEVTERLEKLYPLRSGPKTTEKTTKEILDLMA